MFTKKAQRFLDPAAFILGILLGLSLPRYSDLYKAVGSVYVNLLKLLALPVLMCMVYGAISKPAKKNRLLPQVLAIFILMFAATFLLTALVNSLVQPGNGVVIPDQAWDGETTSFSFSTFVSKVIPSNLLYAISAGDFLPCILIAAALGFAARKTDSTRLSEWFSDLEKVFLKLLEYVMRFTPIGVFFLMAATASNGGAGIISTGIKYILLAWACSILALIFIMLLPVCLIKKITPLTYFKKIKRIVLNTVSTCSSAATLPITISVCKNEFDIDDDICGLTAPLGCTIHMCGGAVSFCLLAFFSCQMGQQKITFGLFLLMLLTAEIINMAAPGIPGGGIVIGASYLSLLGAPLGIMGMYSGIYRFLDMAYTSLNVLGDITANVILQHIRNIKEKTHV